MRLAGYGEATTFFVPADEPGFVRANERFVWRFTPPGIARAPCPVRMSIHKAPGTTRIFVLGSSAAQGFPDPAYGPGRFLEAMYAATTSSHVEVVNVALTAMNSHVVRVIADECARYEPDVFLVYCGNNEVVGPFGPGTVFAPFQRSSALIRLQVWMSGTRTGQALRDVMRRLRGPRELRWGGMEMFAASRIAADDPRLRHVYRHFRENLSAIAAVGERAGARVVLCTVPVNLMDCPPFAGSNRLAGATADDLFAAGRFAEARDADGLRFRADSKINEAVREVAKRRGQEPVDLENVLTGGSGFLEHVHLSPEGTWRAAGAVFAYLTNAPVPSFEVCRARLALTPYDRARLAQAVADLCARPPFTFQQGHAARQAERLRELEALRAGLTPETAAAARADYEAALRARPDDDWLLAGQAELLASTGDKRGALEAWRRTAALRPHHGETRLKLALAIGAAGDPAAAIAMINKAGADLPQLPAVRKAVGDLLIQQGDSAGAQRMYREALVLRPDYADALANLGALRMREGPEGAREAEDLLRRSLALADGDTAHASLATLLTKSGRFAESLPHFERALLARPDDAALHNNHGIALASLGRLPEAAREFEAALRLDPGHAGARRSLERIRAAAR